MNALSRTTMILVSSVLGLLACATDPATDDSDSAGGAVSNDKSKPVDKAQREKGIRAEWYKYTWEADWFAEHPDKEPVKSVYCDDDGKSTPVLFQKRKNGQWSLRDYHVRDGSDESKDPDVISVNSYPWIGCKDGGMKFTYNVKRKEIDFSYTYDSGELGGGCQTTKGSYKHCLDDL